MKIIKLSFKFVNIERKEVKKMTDLERDNLKKGQEERDKILIDLKKGQDELFNGQEKLFNGQEETNKELRKLSQTVARIEYEHGGKIQAILDTISSYPEKFESIENRLESIETKIDRHSDQIYCLNSKVQAF